MSEALKCRLRDPNWRYVPANATDISRTFARIKREQKQAQAVKASANVKQLRKTAK